MRLETLTVSALDDPNLKYKHARIIINGPKSLSQAWILQAMKLKYSYESRITTRNVED